MQPDWPQNLLLIIFNGLSGYKTSRLLSSEIVFTVCSLHFRDGISALIEERGLPFGNPHRVSSIELQ